jgi:hypothetical protein
MKKQYLFAFFIVFLVSCTKNPKPPVGQGSIVNVITSSVKNVTSGSAISGGTINSGSELFISQRGVCWSTVQNPTTSNSKTSAGTGNGIFSSTLTSLKPNTTYYVRAYATNSSGTFYGSNVSFKTLLSAPSLVSPTNGITARCCYVNFSWTSVSGGTGYEINVSKSSIFSGTVYTINVCGGTTGNPKTSGVNKAIVSSTSFCMNGGTTIHNGTWYWRVRAFNGNVNGPWSNTSSYSYSF